MITGLVEARNSSFLPFLYGLTPTKTIGTQAKRKIASTKKTLKGRKIFVSFVLQGEKEKNSEHKNSCKKENGVVR